MKLGFAININRAFKCCSFRYRLPSTKNEGLSGGPEVTSYCEWWTPACIWPSCSSSPLLYRRLSGIRGGDLLYAWR